MKSCMTTTTTLCVKRHEPNTETEFNYIIFWTKNSFITQWFSRFRRGRQDFFLLGFVLLFFERSINLLVKKFFFPFHVTLKQTTYHKCVGVGEKDEEEERNKSRKIVYRTHVVVVGRVEENRLAQLQNLFSSSWEASREKWKSFFCIVRWSI